MTKVLYEKQVPPVVVLNYLEYGHSTKGRCVFVFTVWFRHGAVFVRKRVLTKAFAQV